MKASFYECDITPPLGGFMWGYYRKQIAEDVFERLYSKALVIEDNGTYAAILAIDTCSVPSDMREFVTKRIYEYTGIKPENVCISSNHTHRGAPVHDSPEILCFSDSAYKDVFYRLSADAVILAYKRLGKDNVKIKFGKAPVEGIAFNRNGELIDGTLVTHVRGRENLKKVLGKVDNDLSLVYFEKNEKPIGAIVNFSCHQDTTGGVMGYTGDYASVISEILKERYGNSFVSLFLLGACGNINHSNHDININSNKLMFHREIGEKLASEIPSIIENAEQISGELNVITESVSISRRTISEDEIKEKIIQFLSPNNKLMRARNLITYLSSNEEDETLVYIQGIKIGDLLISALPGELYTEIGINIKEKSPFSKNIVVENCHKYLGYVPLKELFTEKNDLYETSLCYHSNLIPEASDIIENKALEIANKLYK